MEQAKFAVTHASGLLAEALLERMAASGIKSDSVVLLDQEDQSGNRLSYGDTYLTVEDQHEYDYEDLTAILLLEPDAELESLLEHADCFVISHFDNELDQLFVTPDVDRLSGFPKQPCAIKLASAELSSLILPVRIIEKYCGLISLNVVSVLSSSSYGKAGVEELASQTVRLLNSQDISSSIFPLQLAFNMIPGESSSDMEDQLGKILQSNALKCSVQNILVPAFHGLSISINVETRDAIDVKKITKHISDVSGVKLIQQGVSPVTHCKTGSDVIITGLYHPQNDMNRLQFWVIADSVRNGLVQNYLNVLEILLKSFL